MRDLDNPRLTCILRNVSYNPLHGPSTTRDNPPASPATSRRTQTRRKHSASPGPDSPLTRPFSGSSSCGEQQPRPYTQNFHAQCPGSSRHPQERKGAQGNQSSSLYTHPLTGATDAFRTSVTQTPTQPCDPDMSLSSFHTQNLKKAFPRRHTAKTPPLSLCFLRVEQVFLFQLQSEFVLTPDIL